MYEPSTGLHFADVHILVDILARLTEGGNSVIVIEHNLDVLKAADYVIELGPEGGQMGGELLFAGTPHELLACPVSVTAPFLQAELPG